MTGPASDEKKEEQVDEVATSSSADQDGGVAHGNQGPRQAGSSSAGPATSSASTRPPPSSKRSAKHRIDPSTFSSSVDRSFTSIPEETAEDIASLEEQNQKYLSPRRYSEPASPHVMAGLAPFGKSTFRHLMAGGGLPQPANPVTTTKNHNDREEMIPDPNGPRGAFLPRFQGGIRYDSEESFDLPESAEILHHISSSCKGDFTSAQIGMGPRRESSYGSEVNSSAVSDTPADRQDTLDAIESEFNVLKTEITALRANENRTPNPDTALKMEDTAGRPEEDRTPGPDTSLKTEATALRAEENQTPKPETLFKTDDFPKLPSPRRKIPAPIRVPVQKSSVCGPKKDTAPKTEDTAPKTEDSASKSEETAPKSEDFPKLSNLRRETAVPTPVEKPAVPAKEDTAMKAEDFARLPSPRREVPVPVSVPEEEPSPYVEEEYHPRAAAFVARLDQEKKDKEAREAKEKEKREYAALHPTPIPMDEGQFPGLGTPSSTASSRGRARPSVAGRGSRKASYASAASSGMKVAVDKPFSGRRSDTGSDVVSTVSATRSSRGSISSFNSPQQSVASPQVCAEPSDVGDSSVIISPQLARASASPVQTMKPAPWTSGAKQSSPRFAQPTKATARRADETLRKDSAITIGKASPEGSPKKSVRTVAQRQQKRQPLPGAWTSSPETSPTKPSFAAGSMQPTSPSRFQAATPSSLEKKAASPKVASPEQGIRKKTSTYMSPTKATTRRNIETLGEEHVRQSPPRLSKAVATIDTNLSPVKATMSPMENTPPLSMPMSGSTLTSGSSAGVEQTNITDAVMKQLGMGKPAEPPAASIGAEQTNITDAVLRQLGIEKPSGTQATSTTTLEGGASRTVSSTSTNVFESPLDPALRTSRRSTVSSPAADFLAARAREAGFPTVANTVVKRRGSHGHILYPILKRLDKAGLCKFPRSVAKEPQEQTQTSPLMPGLSVQQENVPMPPPTVQQAPTMAPPVHLPPHMLREMSFQAKAQNPASNAPNVGLAALQARSQSSRTGSLRATAQEFKPMWQPQNVQQEVGQLGWEGMLDYRSTEEWHSLQPDVQDTIRRLRHAKAEGRISPVRRPHDAYPSARSSPERGRPVEPRAVELSSSIPQNPQDFNMTNSVLIQYPVDDYPTDECDYFVGKHAPEPHVVENGVILRPEFDAATNTIQWIRQGSDGRQGVISFGRAPAPIKGAPNVSPSSADTSFSKNVSPPTPDTPRRWRIGSLMNDKYGWKGGDGLEISFRGSGANAERDPNPPQDVNFAKDEPRGSQPGNNGARFVGGNEGDGPTSPPLAPRSREQWAKLMGYPRTPCGELNILRAIEHVAIPPIPGQRRDAFGYCRPCFPEQ